MQSTSWEILGWRKHKLEWRFLGEISITSDMLWHHPYGRKWSRTKEPRDESERGECKSWHKLKLENYDHGIQSYHFMANRWGNSGNSGRLYFVLGSKITADGDCSHEIKRCLLLGRKLMTNLDSIFKSRDITLPTKFHLVKAMVFQRKLCTEELMLLNCGVREDTWESLGLQGNPTSPS